MGGNLNDIQAFFWNGFDRYSMRSRIYPRSKGGSVMMMEMVLGFNFLI